MRLEKFLKKYRIETRVKDEVEYRQVTISQHTGVKYRGNKLGLKIGRKRQFIVDLEKYPNTVMFTRQGLKDGAIGFAPKEVHNCIVTENMPTLSVNTDIVDIQFLERLLNSNYFLRKISELSIVGSAQKSIHERDLLKLDIDIPDLETQKLIANKIVSKESNYSSLFNEIQTQKQLLTQLKQSILQEAIQGKLTADWREQNPNTEPASELLKRIKAEKDQLIKDKLIKRGKKQISNELLNHKFKIPQSWAYVDLDDVSIMITDGTHQTPTYVEKGRMFLSAQNVKPFKFMPENHRFVSEEAYQGYISNRKTEKGDLLLGRVGAGIGETAVVDQDLDFAIYVSLGLVKTFKEDTDPNYLAIVFNSPYGIRYAKGNVSSEGGSAGNFNLGRIRSFSIPFPPLEEQKAIVEKVETLMKKCQALEQEIKTSEANAQMLMQAVLKEAFEGKKEESEGFKYV